MHVNFRIVYSPSRCARVFARRINSRCACASQILRRKIAHVFSLFLSLSFSSLATLTRMRRYTRTPGENFNESSDKNSSALLIRVFSKGNQICRAVWRHFNYSSPPPPTFCLIFVCTRVHASRMRECDARVFLLSFSFLPRYFEKFTLRRTRDGELDVFTASKPRREELPGRLAFRRFHPRDVISGEVHKGAQRYRATRQWSSGDLFRNLALSTLSIRSLPSLFPRSRRSFSRVTA